MSTVPINSGRKYSLPRDLEKKLPHNPDAERAVLGAVLLDSDALKRTGELSATDFFLDQHSVVFKSMAKMAEDLQPIDLITLTDELMREGQIEAAGGAGYVASLGSGIPRVSNVEYYSKLIREDAKRRLIVKEMYRIEQLAYEEGADVEDLENQVDLFLRQHLKSSGKENPAVVVNCKQLVSLVLPKANPLIDPLVTEGGTTMMFSAAGVGKSWIASEIAFRLACGIPTIFDGHRGVGGHWKLCGPTRTLYLYGEMHGEKIRERLMLIAKGNRVEMPEGLGVMSKDYQRTPGVSRAAQEWRPCIGPDEKHRNYIEERIFGEGYKLLVLDNVSTLWSAAQEEQSKQTAVLKDWFIDLNARGVSVMVLQHAGKSGDYLGDSAQTHILDSMLKLTTPQGHKRNEGLRAILDLGKLRYELEDTARAVPFEAALQTSAEEGAQWLTRPAREGQKKAAFGMFKNAMPTMFVGQEVGVPRATIYRWKAEFDENPNPDFYGQSDED